MDELDDILGEVGSMSKQEQPSPTPLPQQKKLPATKSQQLRFVLYERWQNQASAAMQFEAFYNREMDRIITAQKNLIPSNANTFPQQRRIF